MVTMNDRAIELLKALNESAQPVQIKSLAARLNVSQRTVRNYIRELNGHNPFIESGRKGITFDADQVSALIKAGSQSLIPQDFAARQTWLIRQLLLFHNQPDFEETCDELFVGSSTLKGDLVMMNRQYGPAGIRFGIRQGKITFSGDERAVRQVIESLVLAETEDQYMHLGVLRSVFPEGLVDQAAMLWNDVLARCDIVPNDLLFVNLVYQASLIITRSPHGEYHHIAAESQIATLLCNEMERRFSIVLSPQDRLDLENLTRQAAGLDVVEKNTVEFCQDLVKALNERFYIALDEQSFVPLFASHVQQLRIRLHRRQAIANPLTQTIRNSSPMIYDMAVYAASRFYERFGFLIDESEIAFFALHIGTQLEFSTTRLRLVAICPDYHEMKRAFCAALRENFGREVQVIEGDAATQGDLVVSAVKMPAGTRYVAVSPFLHEADLKQVRKAIDKCRQEKGAGSLVQEAENMLDEDLFKILASDPGREKLLETLCSEIVELGYAREGLLESVLEREKACSTAYEGFAVPHALLPQAIESCIAIAIIPSSMAWQNRQVRVVFLMNLRKEDTAISHTLYSTIVKMLLDGGFVEKMAACSDFDTFRKLFLEALPSYI